MCVRGDEARESGTHVEYLELLKPSQLVADRLDLVVGEVERAQVLLLVPRRRALIALGLRRHAQVGLRAAPVVRRIAV